MWISIRRRTAAQVQSQKTSALTAEPDEGLPSHWCPVADGTDYVCVLLDPMDSEYKKAEKFFRETMGEVHPEIFKIHRVQNPDLWTFYNQ